MMLKVNYLHIYSPYMPIKSKIFLSAMSLRRTSKDLNSCPPPPSPLRQNLDKNQNLNKQVNSNVNKEFLPKNSSQKNPPKKILPKNPLKKSSKKISPKKFLQKNPSENFPKNFQKKFPKKFQIFSKNSEKLPSNFSKNS